MLAEKRRVGDRPSPSPRGDYAILRTTSCDRSLRNADQSLVRAAMKRPDLAALERAVRELQRGIDRERNAEILFRHFRPRLERFLAPRVYSPEERRDLTQVTFLRIYQGLEGFRWDGSLEGWVLQVAWNVYRKWLDKQLGGRQAAPEVAVDPAMLPEAAESPDLPSPSALALPLDRVVGAERRQALRAAIGELPPQQRLCTVLRIYQDRSVQEIAVALRISPETVKAHLFQARQKLTDRLRGLFGTINF